ncbi:MAG: TIGR01906 family membrane protein [Roseburia sp.]|nr:TIGR01906 family membrane protein [Roseburia sp.]
MTDRKKRAVNVTLTVIFIIALVLFMLTFSIGLPIYCRFFYYIQINTLNLPAQAASYGIKAGYWDIKQAYDEVLNFCTLPNRPFGSGMFEMSESGISHFADCKILFDLNLSVMIVSGAATLALVLLNRFKVIEFLRIKGHRPYLISAIVAVALPLVIGALAAIDFDRAFEIFHGIFFPGKSNWTFNPYYDQIITVMPEQFFMNCAIIIGAGLIAFAAALIAADLILFYKEKKSAEKITEKETETEVDLPEVK